MHALIAGLLVATAGLVLSAQLADNTGADFSKKPPILPLAASDQATRFLLPPGYRMEIVAAEPDVVNPAVIEWDGNGRMYISEFRSYMRDLEGTSQHDPINRISRWEDTNADGTYDRRTIFADRLVFPRMILAVDQDCILTNESHSDDVVKWCDVTDDGVADTRTVWYAGVGRGRGGNLEHEQSNFVWGLDNWIYSTFNAFRFRWTPGGVLREPTGANGGQFGLTQDDDGKMWFINAGGERGPVNFQVPIQYGAFSVDDQVEPGFAVVWPAPSIGDMQGGMGRVRQPIGALNHFTATAGANVFRGDRLPADLSGDLFITEPVGRLVRRAKIVKSAGLTQLRNATPGSEFLLGTDPLFRPVNLRTGPDGVLYIADMYHGIIQEATWAPAGSYLRRKIQQYQLEAVIDHGRVWRLRYDGTEAIEETAASGSAPRGAAVAATPALALDLTRPRMLDATSADLVAHLSHPNGWWRDMAQRLLVLRQDRSVVPALQATARRRDNVLGRIHAIWTLEGLGALDAALVRELMRDTESRIRTHAIRASETLYKAGNLTLAADYRAAAGDSTPDVAIQAMLTLNSLKVPDAASVIRATMASDRARGVQLVGTFLLTPPPAPPANPSWTAEQREMIRRGEAIYTELCAACHGADGRGTPLAGAPGVTMAPPLAGSPRVQGHRDYVVKALLHGLVGGVDGRTYTQVMIPMGAQTDDWIASVGSYVRSSLGNDAPLLAPTDVARVRTASARRKTSWTVAEIASSLPVPLEPASTWQVTASHNSAAARAGLTLAGWTSGQPQQKGMWYQVELPETVMLAEVQFDAAGGGPLGRAARAGGTGASPTTGYARLYQIQVSTDGRTWTAPVASAVGTPLNVQSFGPVRARFVRVTLTGTDTGAPAWVVQHFRLSRAPDAR